jgi:hypothetical protein
MRSTAFRLIPVLATALLAADAPDPNPGPAKRPSAAFRWTAGGGAVGSAVELQGLDRDTLSALARSNWDAARWAEMFAVSVASAGSQDQEPPPILGTYRVVEGAVRFEPRFPWEPGLTLRARFRPSRLLRAPRDGERELVSQYTPPVPEPAPPARVVRVDPTGDRLPENLLKFYLHFSRPMSRGEAYRRVRLLDASGRPLELPFLELGEELWDPSGTRLTLLLDPGRIKRGLRPREEEGPVLESGRGYVLAVDRAWPDAEGRPLVASYRKPFRAGPADETQPDPRSWTLEMPPAGGDEPLGVNFPEPLDRAMLDRVLEVRGPDGLPVPGRVEVSAAAKRWSFRPQRAWSPGRHTIVIDSALEDRAGNSIARPFEVDVAGPITQRAEAETVTLPFEIR